jgi:hypothetical protein
VCFGIMSPIAPEIGLHVANASDAQENACVYSFPKHRRESAE